MNFTEEETMLLKQYQQFPTGVSSLARRLVVEIVPPIVFVALGLITGRSLWFLALIIMLVGYNIQRIVRQQKSIRLLRQISQKVIGEESDGSSAPAGGTTSP